MVNEAAPTKHYFGTKSLYIGTNAGDTRYPFIYFALPFRKGVQIISAKLHFYNVEAWAGTITVTAKPIASKWSFSALNWSNKPGVLAGSATLAKTGAAAKTHWEMDIKSIMQTVSNGGVWYGLRLDANGSAIKRIFSAESSSSLRPYVEIVWSDAPRKPVDLYPRDGGTISVQYPTFQTDFTDFSGSTDMAGMNVRVFTTEADAIANSSPEWDSGDVLKTEPELWTDPASSNYVSMPAWSGIPDGATRWWRVRVKDGAGIWSPWSDHEAFSRDVKGTVAITNPADSPNNFVWEATPPFAWTFTGETQKHRQVFVRDLSTGKIVWDTGKITTTDTTVTMMDKILQDGVLYKVYVRIWDGKSRVKLPNDDIFVEASKEFTLNYDAATAGVSSITAVDQFPFPWAKIEWSRATMPDRFDIYRNGKIIASDIANEFFVSGTNYQYIDMTAPPYVQHTYKVVAVVNSKGSQTNPTEDLTIRSFAPCLANEDGSVAVFLMNPNVSAAQVQVQEVVEFIGDAPPILVTAGERGFEGSASFVLTDIQMPGYTSTAQQQKANFKTLRKNPGEILRFWFWDEATECFIYNSTYSPTKDAEGLYYPASFQFVQVDY